MFSQARALFEGFAHEYRVRDLDRAFAYIHDEVRFAMHIPRDVGPFAVYTVGKAEARARIEMIAQALELVRWDAVLIRPSVGAVRVHLEFHWRHRATGEDLIGASRQIWTMRDDLLASCDDFHDSPRVAAFFRLVAVLPPTEAPIKPREQDESATRMKAAAALAGHTEPGWRSAR